MPLPTQPPSRANRQPAGIPIAGQFAETIKSADVGSPIDQQSAVSEKEVARTKLAEATRNIILMYARSGGSYTGLSLSKDSDGNLKGVAIDAVGNEVPNTWSDVTHRFEREGGIRAEPILGDKDSDTFTFEEIRGWGDEPADADEATGIDVAVAAPVRPVRPTLPDSLVKQREKEALRDERTSRIKAAMSRLGGTGEPRS